MNGKFVEKYGATWADLDNDNKMMVICSEIFDLREEMREFKDTCEIVKKHVLYWKIALFIVSPIWLATIAVLIGNMLK